METQTFTSNRAFERAGYIASTKTALNALRGRFTKKSNFNMERCNAQAEAARAMANAYRVQRINF